MEKPEIVQYGKVIIEMINGKASVSFYNFITKNSSIGQLYDLATEWAVKVLHLEIDQASGNIAHKENDIGVCHKKLEESNNLLKEMAIHMNLMYTAYGEDSCTCKSCRKARILIEKASKYI